MRLQPSAQVPWLPRQVASCPSLPDEVRRPGGPLEVPMEPSWQGHQSLPQVGPHLRGLRVLLPVKMDCGLIDLNCVENVLDLVL